MVIDLQRDFSCAAAENIISNLTMDNNTPLRSDSTIPKKTTLFKQGPQSGSSQQVTYRIPALIYISENHTFLAFAEKRKSSDDTNAEILVMKRGILRVGKVEWDSKEQVLDSAYLPNHRTMNPCPVYERETKTLFLFFITVPVGVSEDQQIKTKTNRARLCYVTSKETGENWSTVKDLTGEICEREKNWATFAVGPGHGVQLQKGRLIIPAYAYRYTGKPACTSFCCLSFCCFTPYALAFYSDDQGTTWKAGNQMDVESCECLMAEIIDDKGDSILYCNARTRLGYRTEALSYNSGEDFNKVLSSNNLKETGKHGCQGSVLSFPKQSPPQTWLLYSHPSDPDKRVDLGLYLNKTPLDSSGWGDKPVMILHSGPSAYSDLVEYESGCFACLMECGKEREIEEIAFALFELPEK